MYADRADAGRQLATDLLHLKDQDPVLLALPRGGVPVAFEIAKALAAPLGLVFVRKLGAPYNREFALGAVADGDPPVVVLHEHALRMLDLSEGQMAPSIDRELAEIQRRRGIYGPEALKEDLAAKTVILVDDGIATGATMEAAIAWVRRRNPRRIVVAVPIGSPSTLDKLGTTVDEVVCPSRDEWMSSVGSAYMNFEQVDDSTVSALLRRAAEITAGDSSPDSARA